MANNPTRNKPHRGVSKRLKKCTKCKRVWETQYQTRNTIYYEEFPTIGLERKDCKRCTE